MRAQWDPVARRLSQTDLDQMETPPPPAEQGTLPTTPTTRPPSGAGAYNRNAFFFREGALGVLSTNKGHGVVNVLGGSRTDGPDTQLPRIAIEAEHYGRIARSVMLGMPVVIEADIRNAWYDNPEMFNVVGEIRGTTQPNEVVIIGGHFDSWHASTGATDNGGACSALMEAMRLLKATNAPLKRTVRICLWNGEEQGLIGSRLYVAKHFGGARGVPSTAPGGGFVMEPVKRDHSRFQAYFNVDNGAGAIRGVHCQGNRAIAPIFKRLDGAPARPRHDAHLAAHRPLHRPRLLRRRRPARLPVHPGPAGIRAEDSPHQPRLLRSPAGRGYAPECRVAGQFCHDGRQPSGLPARANCGLIRSEVADFVRFWARAASCHHALASKRLTITRRLVQISRMIVCVCRALNTAKVNDAIAAGARSPAQVHRHHDTTINCGKCCETVCGMIREQKGMAACSTDQQMVHAE